MDARNPHGVKLISVDEMLEERRAMLARIDAAEPHPGLERFRREIEASIRTLEARKAKERGEQP